MTVYRLRADSVAFPPVDHAELEPNGLLAVGGDLSPGRLLSAYASGIFPWYERGQPLLWWSPDPRTVLEPSSVRISRSLRRTMRRGVFSVTVDRRFADVVEGCAAPRSYASGSWITDEMQRAYVKLHELGYAHSVEVWQEENLVGGLYGVALGSLFFGESMFHRVTDASKVAFASLCRLLDEAGCPLIDCQLENEHLTTLGAVPMSRREFQDLLCRHVDDRELNWTEIARRATMLLRSPQEA